MNELLDPRLWALVLAGTALSLLFLVARTRRRRVAAAAFGAAVGALFGAALWWLGWWGLLVMLATSLLSWAASPLVLRS
ncbi:MAG TPA: hypothetical protein VMT16_07870 [Thermoanaerobaculia bacterium]|nr:hypothetical protein [Thermoanaerobaculia bacterium]